VNDEQHVIVFNKAAEQMFRCPASRALGLTIDRFIPEHIRTLDRTDVTSCSTGAPGALVARRGDGEEFPIEATISQVEAAGPERCTVIVRDIRERMRLEEALRQRAEELAEADLRKDEFLAMLAHELRNPLAPIRNALHVLRVRGPDDPALERFRNVM